MTKIDNWIISEAEFDELTAEGNVVVLFTAPAWCQPCIRFEPHYVRATQFFEDESLPVKFFRVDVDTSDWAVVRFGVRGVPTCYLMVNGNKERELKVPQNGLPFIADIRNELGV